MNNSKKRDSYEVNNNENPERPADGESRRGATTVSASEWRGVLNFKANLMNLPYFKFMVQDYLSGDIQACSMQTQGIYINLMARIWKKKGSLDTSQAPLAKLLRVTEQELLDSINELLDMGILIKNKDGSISVKFLLKQIDEINEDHERNVEMGRKGGLKSAQLRSRGGQPPLNHTDTESETNTDSDSEKDNINTGGDGDKKGSGKKPPKPKDEKPPWKTSYEIYLKSCTEAYNQLISDHGFIQQQEEFHPGVDVKLSLKKAFTNYWGTEVGWKKRKRAQTKELDWKATFTNALNLNKVYKPRTGQVDADRRREEKAAKECPEPDYSKLIRSY